jgi:hypothetical protein
MINVLQFWRTQFFSVLGRSRYVFMSIVRTVGCMSRIHPTSWNSERISIAWRDWQGNKPYTNAYQWSIVASSLGIFELIHGLVTTRSIFSMSETWHSDVKLHADLTGLTGLYLTSCPGMISETSLRVMSKNIRNKNITYCNIMSYLYISIP